MEIGDIMRTRRQELGLTLEDVGNFVGVGKSTVRKWERGDIENMKRDKINLLSQVLKLSPLTFITGEVAYGMPDNIIPLPKTKAVPLLGTIACGKPILAVENVSCYVRIDEEVKVDFALECKGDSMINARIFDGDIVYIREQPDVENGEIAAVLIGEEATLKKVYKYPSKIVLCPENPLYDDIVCSEEKMNEVRILGKAVAFLSIVRHRKDVKNEM